MPDNFDVIQFALYYLFGGYAAASMLLSCAIFGGLDSLFGTYMFKGIGRLHALSCFFLLLPYAVFQEFDFSGQLAVYFIWCCITICVACDAHKTGKKKSKKIDNSTLSTNVDDTSE